MEVRHMLVVGGGGEHLIRSLVGWHCRPAEALAGTAVEVHFGILDEAHLSIPALARSGIVDGECSCIVAEGHSCILGLARFGTALEGRCCTPGGAHFCTVASEHFCTLLWGLVLERYCRLVLERCCRLAVVRFGIVALERFCTLVEAHSCIPVVEPASERCCGLALERFDTVALERFGTVVWEHCYRLASAHSGKPPWELCCTPPPPPFLAPAHTAALAPCCILALERSCTLVAAHCCTPAWELVLAHCCILVWERFCILAWEHFCTPAWEHYCTPVWKLVWEHFCTAALAQNCIAVSAHSGISGSEQHDTLGGEPDDRKVLEHLRNPIVLLHLYPHLVLYLVGFLQNPFHLHIQVADCHRFHRTQCYRPPR